MIIDSPNISLIPSLRALWKVAFGDDDAFLDVFYSTAFDPERCRCATVDGKVASALYWFNCQYDGSRIAYLYAIATAVEFRGQGICHRLMDNTLQHLASLGYEGAILVPAREDLFGFYESMGYKTCSYISKTVCAASDEKIALRQIDADEYAELRRTFLPDRSVLQEGENLRLLEKMAHFYVGADLLLAARDEEGALFGIELLGNADVCPEIVNSLGYSQGSFKSVGSDIPFAVYQPLGDSSLPPPAYFGLSLS